MPRPTKSTARFISYDLRPAKQSERGILVDILKVAGDCGLPIRDYRYVGMGANRFYDFLLLHKYVGIQDMISLEHDGNMYQRARYNVPYHFIDVQNKKAFDFLTSGGSEKPEIIWLDYDGGIGPDMLVDITTLSARAKIGDFFFVTVNGEEPHYMNGFNDIERLQSLQDTMGDHAGSVVLEDVERSQFSNAVYKVLIAAFRYAFSVRREGSFVPLLQVEYSDSMPMVTVGGAFLSEGTAIDLCKKMKKTLPFLLKELYKIRSFHLTERERSLFDRALTGSPRSRKDINTLKKLGFKESEFVAYGQLIRYLPRYVETAV